MNTLAAMGCGLAIALAAGCGDDDDSPRSAKDIVLELFPDCARYVNDTNPIVKDGIIQFGCGVEFDGPMYYLDAETGSVLCMCSLGMPRRLSAGTVSVASGASEGEGTERASLDRLDGWARAARRGAGPSKLCGVSRPISAISRFGSRLRGRCRRTRPGGRLRGEARGPRRCTLASARTTRVAERALRSGRPRTAS